MKIALGAFRGPSQGFDPLRLIEERFCALPVGVVEILLEFRFRKGEQRHPFKVRRKASFREESIGATRDRRPPDYGAAEIPVDGPNHLAQNLRDLSLVLNLSMAGKTDNARSRMR